MSYGNSAPTSALPTSAPALQTSVKSLTVTPVPQDPLAYVSPQSAIAAGLDPAAVGAAWFAQVNSFATVQDGITAGVPPGVMTEFWTGGTPPAPPPWSKRLTLGVPNGVWAVGGGFLALLLLPKGREA